MKKRESIEDFIQRAADACRLTKVQEMTLMMQAQDTDPLSFTSVLRIGNDHPFGDNPDSLAKMVKVSGLVRDRTAAHDQAARMIHMEDINRNPDFVNAYLKVTADGDAKIYVHYGLGVTTRILENAWNVSAPAQQDVAV